MSADFYVLVHQKQRKKFLLKKGQMRKRRALQLTMHEVLMGLMFTLF